MTNHWDQLEAALSDELYAAAWRYCCRLSPAREDAEDLLQDALLHASVKLPQLRDQSRFKAWLFALIRSRFLNRPRRTILDLLPDHPGPALQGSDPLSDAIAEALPHLPVVQREVVELFYFDDLSLAETAQVLRLPQITVKQRLFRARESLRRLLPQARLAQQGEAP